MSVADYRADRIAELGEFMGTIIGGIYEGIRGGHFDAPSDFAAAAGRAHQSWTAWFAGLKAPKFTPKSRRICNAALREPRETRARPPRQ